MRLLTKNTFNQSIRFTYIFTGLTSVICCSQEKENRQQTNPTLPYITDDAWTSSCGHLLVLGVWTPQWSPVGAGDIDPFQWSPFRAEGMDPFLWSPVGAEGYGPPPAVGVGGVSAVS